ncbi:MAG TPA: immunoglobulin domain-containing protein [Verrucomicrobiae bacterium]|nr:immunoglobulin domain-containing protein [Verrucomicrobiae bacterium]
MSSLTAGGQAALLVGPAPTGTGVQTFDALPAVSDWSTVRVPLTGGANTTYTTAAALDAAVIANTVAANVNVVLNMSATVPVSQNELARWNSTGLWLQTRPTIVDYAILMVTLQNDTGGNQTQLTVSYDWNQGNNIPVNEDIPGHRVFFSMDGSANSWVLIPEFSTFTTSSTAQGLSATLNLGAWAQGSLMYIIWVDDNGPGGQTDPMEGGYSIDNFTAIPGPPMMPTINTSPTNTTAGERGTVTFTVSASGATSYKWFHGATELANGTTCVLGNNRVVSGATGSALTIQNVQLTDAGQYHAQAINIAGMANSGNATLTVNADTNAPSILLVYPGANLNEIIVVLSEPLNDSCLPIGLGGAVSDTGNWLIEDVGGGGLGAINFTNTTLAGATVLGFICQNAHVPTLPLKVTLFTTDLFDTSAAQNVLTQGTYRVVTELVPLSAMWTYNDQDIDPGANWFATDPGLAYPSGPGPFDAKRDGGILHANGLDDCRANTFYSLGAVGTCLGLQSPVTGTNLISSYFWTHFNYAGNSRNEDLLLLGKFDDGGVVYLNGVEVARVRMPAAPAPITHTTFSTGPTVNDGDLRDVILLPQPAEIKVGDNLLATSLHQANLTSSDLTMGFQVFSVEPTSTVKVRLAFSGANRVLSWTPRIGRLEVKNNLNDPTWTVLGTANPFTDTASQSHRFYRVYVLP